MQRTAPLHPFWDAERSGGVQAVGVRLRVLAQAVGDGAAVLVGGFVVGVDVTAVSADDVEPGGVGLATIKRAEASDGEVRMIPANLAAVQQTLETGGVLFIQSGEGVGVLLKTRSE